MLKEDMKSIEGSNTDIRKFALIICIASALFATLLFWREKDYYQYFYYFAAGFLVVGLISPSVLKPVYKAWMKGALAIGWVMTRVILGALFYLVFSLIGLISKLTGKHFLDLKMDGSEESYWIDRKNEHLENSYYERQF